MDHLSSVSIRDSLKTELEKVPPNSKILYYYLSNWLIFIDFGRFEDIGVDFIIISGYRSSSKGWCAQETADDDVEEATPVPFPGARERTGNLG